MPHVSVVVPCYNYAQYLSECVESVLSQEGASVRVLILDDCSPDRTPEVAAELNRKDSRIEYRRHEFNMGHIHTYNEGLLEWATGDFCLLLSADDLLAPGALKRAATVFASHPEVGLVHGQQLTFDVCPPHPISFETRDLHFDALDGNAFIAQCCDSAANPVATPTAIVRTELQRAVGGYRQALPHSADMEMWMRLASRASVARIDAVQAYKRMHSANMQHAYLTSQLGDLRHRGETFDSFFTCDGRAVCNNEVLHGLARKRLGHEAFWAASDSVDRGNHDDVASCLGYALQLYPELKSTREWSRLCLKRRLGVTWRIVYPLVERMRQRRIETARPAA